MVGVGVGVGITGVGVTEGVGDGVPGGDSDGATVGEPFEATPGPENAPSSSVAHPATQSKPQVSIHPHGNTRFVIYSVGPIRPYRWGFTVPPPVGMS